MSERGRRKTTLDALIEQRKRQEIDEKKQKEKKDIARDPMVWLFYKLYPKAELAIASVLLTCMMALSLLTFFGYQVTLVELLFVMFVFSIIYGGIPHVYFTLVYSSGEGAKLDERIKAKRAEGALDF